MFRKWGTMSGTDCLWCETQREAARGMAYCEFRRNDFGNLRPRTKPEEKLISYSLIRGGNLCDNGTCGRTEEKRLQMTTGQRSRSYVLSDSPHAWQHSIRPSYCNHLPGDICQPATIQSTRVLHLDFVEDGASASDDLTTPVCCATLFGVGLAIAGLAWGGAPDSQPRFGVETRDVPRKSGWVGWVRKKREMFLVE